MSEQTKEMGLLRALLSSERFPFDLVLVIILSLITLAIVGLSVIVSDDNALKGFFDVSRILLGIPFLIFLPGYALVSALWPHKSIVDADDFPEESKKSTKDGISDLERIAMSLGLSLAIVALTGLGLNYTPWGITLNSTIIGLFIVIIVFVGLAWIRRSKLSVEERFVVRFDYVPLKFNGLSSTEKVMTALIVISILIGVVVLAYVATNPPQERFSELYILDANRSTENYPVNMSVNEEGRIIIGVVCHEDRTTDYSVIINLFHDDGSNETLEEYSLSLEDDEEWSQVFNFRVSESGTYKLQIELYKEGDGNPYLTNHLWLEIH